LQRAGKAAHDVFAREKKNEDDQKVLEHAIMIMVALRKQGSFKGTRKTKRDLQGVWKDIKGLEMPQGDWVQDSWKKSEQQCKPKSAVTRKQHKPVSQDKINLSAPGGGGWGGGLGWGGGGGGGRGGGGGEGVTVGLEGAFRSSPRKNGDTPLPGFTKTQMDRNAKMRLVHCLVHEETRKLLEDSGLAATHLQLDSKWNNMQAMR
jgi:hypothetical protein